MYEDWEIRKYDNSYEDVWDDFVRYKSINGTFLQERRFLNYHPKERFKDCSILIYYRNNLVAACPACIVVEGAKKTFYSHQGSTYGGFVVCLKIYKTEMMFALIGKFEIFLKENGYNRCVLKPSMNLLSNPSEDLQEFCLCYNGYSEFRELNSYIDYDNYDSNILSNLSHMKQRIIRKCLKAGLELRKLKTDAEIREFHRVLSGNLIKYNRTPIHSVDELIDLKRNRLPEEIEFWGIFHEGRLVAGTMVFLFLNHRCAHTQYLAADLSYNKLSPMSYLYYKIAEYYGQSGYRYLSWGITTEDMGRIINMGLTKNKEEYGSAHNMVRIFVKEMQFGDK